MLEKFINCIYNIHVHIHVHIHVLLYIVIFQQVENYQDMLKKEGEMRLAADQFANKAKLGLLDVQYHCLCVSVCVCVSVCIFSAC